VRDVKRDWGFRRGDMCGLCVQLLASTGGSISFTAAEDVGTGLQPQIKLGTDRRLNVLNEVDFQLRKCVLDGVPNQDQQWDHTHDRIN
jgi:hypothetical protein